MRKPQISVVIPTYNAEADWLKQAINSVLDQGYENVELLVVDDCSCIPHSGIREDFNDHRIRWLLNQRNLGVSAARNHGARVARGAYLAFLDADDWWEKNKLELQMQEMEKSSTTWNYTAATLCDSAGKPLSTARADKSNWVYDDLLKRQVIAGSCSGVVVKKSTFIEAGLFEEKGDVVEDWDMWLRLAKGNPISCVNVPLVYLRTCIDSRSGLLAQKLERLRRFQEKYRDEYKSRGLLSYSKAHYFYVAARQHFIAGKWLMATFYLSQSLFANPLYFTGGRAQNLLKKVLSYWGAKLRQSGI